MKESFSYERAFLEALQKARKQKTPLAGNKARCESVTQKERSAVWRHFRPKRSDSVGSLLKKAPFPNGSFRTTNGASMRQSSPAEIVPFRL